jgi:hypothetical protein
MHRSLESSNSQSLGCIEANGNPPKDAPRPSAGPVAQLPEPPERPAFEVALKWHLRRGFTHAPSHLHFEHVRGPMSVAIPSEGK